MSHPDRLTEHESRLALISQIDELFTVFPQSISTTYEKGQPEWQNLQIQYLDLDGSSAVLVAGRAYPLSERTQGMPDSVFKRTLRTANGRWFMISDSETAEVKVEQGVGITDITYESDDWELIEELLGNVYAAKLLGNY